MVSDERDRHRLHQRLDDVLGIAEAATLMSHLPPVGWLDVTTNQQLLVVADRTDARFTAVDAQLAAVDTRFAAVDARFDAVDAQLAAVDTRFAAVDARFDALEARMDDRFEVVDIRFGALEGRMDAGFEIVDAKLDALRHDFGERLALGLRDQLRVMVFTFIACMLTFASVVIAAVKL